MITGKVAATVVIGVAAFTLLAGVASVVGGLNGGGDGGGGGAGIDLMYFDFSTTETTTTTETTNNSNQSQSSSSNTEKNVPAYLQISEFRNAMVYHIHLHHRQQHVFLKYHGEKGGEVLPRKLHSLFNNKMKNISESMIMPIQDI